jgi:hypothetical protein
MVDAIFLGLLAIADVALLTYLRRRRRAVIREELMARSLAYAVRREIDEAEQVHEAAASEELELAG